MKKFIPVVAIALFGALSMTSCKKDYTCTCKISAFGADTTIAYSLGKQKKKDAESACDQKKKDAQASIDQEISAAAAAGITIDSTAFTYSCGI